MEPIYPESGRLNRQGALVILQTVVQEDGWLGNIHFLWSGTEDKAFHSSAGYTASYWRYKPAMKGRCGVAMYLTVNVSYSTK